MHARRFVVLSLLIGHAASAATFTVDTSSDDGGAPFQACADAVAGDCSLRGAISKANAMAGADQIVFDIPIGDAGYIAASAHWRIAPASTLPLISDDLVIDGYTQLGASSNTLAPDEGGHNAVLKIELHGFGNFSQAGLDVGNGNPHLTLRGMAINNFRINVQLQSPGPHLIEGCFIGTDISGMQSIAANNNAIGIRQRGQAFIGGTDAAARNVISGNGYIGLWDESGTSTLQPSTVQGNLFGLGADGVSVLPGQDYGMYLGGAVRGGLIGGDSVAARNLFAGNEINAIHYTGNGAAIGTAPTRIQGNWFGSDWSGQLRRPNGYFPQSPTQPQPTINVFLSGRCGVQVGGLAPGEGNRIAHGAAAGIQISTCTGAALVGNAFAGNRLAIDLAPGSIADGATANDAGDADDGGNRVQNHPQIELPADFIAAGGGDSVALSYLIDSSAANASYPITVYFHRAGCGGGGRELIASDTYGEAEAGQVRNFQLEADGNVLPLVAFAIDADGNSSEFGPMLGDDVFVDGLEQEPAAFSVGRCE